MTEGINLFFLKKICGKQLENHEENEIFLANKHLNFGKKERAQGGTTTSISVFLVAIFFFLS